MPDTRQRDQLMRRIIAVLLVLRAATNFGKPFAPGSGFVVFGAMRRGLASTVVAPLFGIAMVVYAWGLWQNRPWARPLPSTRVPSRTRRSKSAIAAPQARRVSQTAAHGMTMPGIAKIEYIHGAQREGTPSTIGKRTTLAVAQSA